MAKITPNFDMEEFWNLLYIVEWPNKFWSFRDHMKAWRIPNWELWATVWHFMQIEDPSKPYWLWIEIEWFVPNYEVDEEKKDNIKELENKIKNADTVFIMTDEDFEWHKIAQTLYDYFKKYKKKFYRTPFTDLDVSSLINSINKRSRNPHNWKNKAWQARAVLDRIIWWWYSPIVRKKANWLKQVSAWRVQSIVMRILAERELEIANHSSSNYYTIWANHPKIWWSWHIENKTKLEDGKFKFSKEDSDEIMKKIWNARIAKVISYEEWTRVRKPNAPFKDSTFQSEASNLLWMSTKRAMQLWNMMVDKKLMSYVRSASIVLQDEKIEKIREILTDTYEKDYISEDVIEYVNPWKKIEEWHYWIAPIDFDITPSEVKKIMWKDWDEASKLYELVWKRAVSSQMSPAKYDTQKMVLDIEWEEFVIKWERMTFEWFLKVYDYREEDEEWEEELSWFKSFEKWDEIVIKEFDVIEHKTKPKPRFNEVSLSKFLENLWIWRPSTRPWIVPNLSSAKKAYIELWKWKKPQIFVTEKWMAVYEALTKFAKNDILNFEYTANMEDLIDKLADFDWKEADIEYEKALSQLYEPIAKVMEENWVSFNSWSDYSSDSSEIEYSDILDPCWNWKDEFLIIRNSSHWRYFKSWLTWANYPWDIEDTWETCPKCKSMLLQASSKAWNKYKFCSASKVEEDNKAWIKKCDYFEWWSWWKQEDTWVECPKCWKWTITKKETSKWLIQICSTWDSCDFFNFLWHIEETEDKCSECWWEMIIKTLPSWSKRKDCINRFYDVKKRKNYWCSNEWDWYND